MTHARRFATAAVVLGVAAGGRPAGSQTVPTGFAVQNVVVDPFVSQPVAFAFLPDGRVLVLEKDTGNVRLAPAGSQASVTIYTVPNLSTEIERGLLGVAVDPAWPTRPYVYMHSTHRDSTARVTLYVASGDLTNPASTNLDLGSPFTLLTIADLTENHQAGTLRFGPDGCLYVSLGDDGYSCDAQDVNVLRGKILRLDVSRMPGSGSGPPPLSDLTPNGNPYSGPTANARLVFAYGLRNPFRFTIDPQTGNLYIGDVGFDTWEEVDEIVRAGYTGSNFGWPAYEGPMPDPCCTDCARVPPFTLPVYFYPNPTGPYAATVIGGPVYRRVSGSPHSFPFEYEGNLFMADFYGRWIRRFVRSGNSWVVAPPVPGQPDKTNWAVELGKVCDMQVGPDGALYCMVWPYVTLPRGLYRIADVSTTDVRPGAPLDAWARGVPNPARIGAESAIEYRLARPEELSVRIYDASGRLVRLLRTSPPTAASGRVRWDGRARDGTAVAPGTYLYRLETPGGLRASGKISVQR